MRPAKIQISLRIRAVSSEYLQGIFWIDKDARVFHADNEDSDQTVRMRRLVWVFIARKCQKVRYLPLRFIYTCTFNSLLLLTPEITKKKQQ